jgi:tRNA-2-methylthio-N6-dimethylallyladenosine synthase
MPFQAGDDQVLRDMRRGYTYESYMRIIRKIREKAPDSAICGDVIVGFPGETEEAFLKTLQLMEEVKFGKSMPSNLPCLVHHRVSPVCIP